MTKLNRYTSEARQALTYAREEAQRLRHRTVGAEHLLLGLLRTNDPLIEGVFSSLQVSTTRVFQALEFVVGRGSRISLSDPAFNSSARQVLTHAEEEATAQQEELIGIEHILLAILRVNDSVERGVLESFGISFETVQQQIDTLRMIGGDTMPYSSQFQARYDLTPTLNLVSRDLTAAAIAGTLDPMIGREEELDRTMQILSRRAKNNPVLIGPSGVGKTAIAEGLAQRIIDGLVPETLQRCRVVALDVGMLTVGTKFRGDFEDRLKQIKQEILTARNLIIVIDELHALVNSGVAEGSIDAANLFKPMLARSEFRCIGATTLDDYRKTIETDSALERRFQPVQVRETTAQETLEILAVLRTRYAQYHHVTISDEALLSAVQMSTRYIPNRFQPDKALDLIDEAASRLSVGRSVPPKHIQVLRDELITLQRDKDYAISRHDFVAASNMRSREQVLRHELHQAEDDWYALQRQESPTVGKHEIATIVATWTGIPVTEIVAEEAEHLLNLESELHRHVIGQHQAVQAVASAVRRSRTNLRDARRPIGSFLFVGPTGVGKTALARTLAATLFGDESAMLKLDMSEFMEGHNAARLIGAPPGYIGYDSAGQLTEAVRRRPYSVVLFDEIEKAHPKVFDLLLQMLEEGRLTDGHGQVVDFRHTIVILTSNIGTDQLAQSEMAFFSGRKRQHEHQTSAYARLKSAIMSALQDAMKPELLNRIDETVVFHALGQEHLDEIVELLIDQVQERLAAQSIELHVSQEARLWLARRGYDQEYGARFLRRVVQQHLEDMLAEAILQGSVVPGSAVVVDTSDEALCIQTVQTSEAHVAPVPGKLRHAA